MDVSNKTHRDMGRQLKYEKEIDQMLLSLKNAGINVPMALSALGITKKDLDDAIIQGEKNGYSAQDQMIIAKNIK